MSKTGKASPEIPEVVADGMELEQKANRTDCIRSSAVAAAMVVVSVILAVVLRDYGTESLPQDVRFASGLIGWIYFCAW